MRWPTIPAPDGKGEMIDQDAVNELVDYAIEHGVNYFDTSPVYVQGWSEKATGDALKRHPRESYYVATKLSNFSNPSREAAMAMYNRSFEELQVDYIDYYLLHSIGGGGMDNFRRRYVDNGMMDFLMEERKAGRIRHLGWSFHGGKDVFDAMLELHDQYHWDFVQIQMNYVDWRIPKGSSIDAEYLYNELAKREIPVVIMEPLLGGRLAKPHPALSGHLSPLDPDASLARWAFRFCGTFPNVITVLSGMTRDKDIAENIETFSPLKPCSKRELSALDRAAAAFLGLKLVVCSHCNYCMPCPYGMDIPELLAFRNEVVMAKSRLSDREILELYRKRIPDPMRRAEHCTGCGRRNPSCPQAIDIPTEIEALTVMMDQIKDRLL
jgi:predicted aldo/keto reductase-like oxidoreductase